MKIKRNKNKKTFLEMRDCILYITVQHFKEILYIMPSIYVSRKNKPGEETSFVAFCFLTFHIAIVKSPKIFSNYI